MLGAALLCGIHLLHVVLTAREEFGFGGDEGYHLSATRAFAIYFIKAGPISPVSPCCGWPADPGRRALPRASQCSR